jgi:hypothetical protein
LYLLNLPCYALLIWIFEQYLSWRVLVSPGVYSNYKNLCLNNILRLPPNVIIETLFAVHSYTSAQHLKLCPMSWKFNSWGTFPMLISGYCWWMIVRSALYSGIKIHSLTWNDRRYFAFSVVRNAHQRTSVWRHATFILEFPSIKEGVIEHEILLRIPLISQFEFMLNSSVSRCPIAT